MVQMSWFARWRYAAKLQSWPKLLVPALLGTGMGADAAEQFNPLAFGFTALFTLCLLLFIVFLNDWADQDVDRLKRTMFPDECSPKTIPDGILPSAALLWAGLLAGILAITTGFGAGFALDRPWLGWGSLVCLGVFAAYTLPPIRLNYRGHGEWLEAVGVGIVLPIWAFSAQSGKIWSIHVWCLSGWFLKSLASALASGLSDEESDRKAGKNTYATRLGNARTRHWIGVSAYAGDILWLLLPIFLSRVGDDPRISIWPWLLGIGLSQAFLTDMKKHNEQATTNAFQAIHLYKGALHKAIWISGSVFALVWIIKSLLY